MKSRIVINPRCFYRFLSSLALSLILLIVLIVSWMPEDRAYGASEATEPLTKIVHSGDTLWHIAEPIAAEHHVDIRVVIAQIQELNRLESSALYPGQELQIPAF